MYGWRTLADHRRRGPVGSRNEHACGYQQSGLHLVRFDACPRKGNYFRLWPVDSKFGDLI